MKKMNMKWLSLVMMVVVMMTVLAPMAFATTPEEDAAKMIFEPMNFVKNLTYMGVGMLGIFIVIGVIIIAVVILNKVTAPKKTDNE